MKSLPAIDHDLLVAAGPQALIDSERRLAMLDAVAYAATRFLANAAWREHIPDLLKRLAHATKMSRVTLFQVHDGPQGYRVQSCRFDWAEEGLATLSDDPRYRDMTLTDDDDLSHMGEWAQRRERGEVIQARLSELTGITRQIFIEHGTFSFLSVPIMVKGRWWGFLGFDDCHEERGWSSAEIHVLKTAAALISAAVERDTADEQIRLSEERYALASRGANDGLFDWDVKSGRAFFSPRLHELMDLQPGTLAPNMDALIALFVATDGDYLRSMLEHKFGRREETFVIECRRQRPSGIMQWFVIRGLIVYDAEGARRIVGGLRDITPQIEAQHKLGEAERMRANLSRYFSSNIVEGLMLNGGKLNEASTQNVTVMFADIWGFTAVSAQMPGTAVIGLLREYLGLAERAVFAHGGTLDKFLGDGLMATFGTPTPGSDDAANALACARAMADAVVKWNAKRKAQGLVPLRIGIGLHCGEVAVGEIGSERRMEFAVIGDTVNIAARIQEMTRELDLAMLASDAVIHAAGPEAASGFRDLGEQAIRGRGGSVRLWGRAAEQD